MARDYREARQVLLRTGIADLQGSIQANDTKASAGLVIHGLLITAIVALITQLGSVYSEAPWVIQKLIIVALGVAFVAFVLSVLFLVTALVPYTPEDLAGRIEDEYLHLFFPLVEPMRDRALADNGDNEVRQLRDKLFKLDSADQRIDSEYLAELAKVADIRQHYADWAKRGFRLLRLEIVAAVVYLLLLALVALGVKAPVATPPLLSAQVPGDASPMPITERPSVDTTARKVYVVAGSKGKLQRVELWANTTYLCPGSVVTLGDTDRPVEVKDIGKRANPGRQLKLGVPLDISGNPCGSSEAATAEVALTVEATDTSGAMSRATVTVHRRLTREDPQPKRGSRRAERRS